MIGILCSYKMRGVDKNLAQGFGLEKGVTPKTPCRNETGAFPIQLVVNISY